MNIPQLPFNALIGLQRCPDDGFIFQLPADTCYTNHLGTVHAAALMALGETTSGEALLLALGDAAGAVIPVVRRFESKFRRPAIGRVRSRCALSAEALDGFTAVLAARGRAGIDVPVEVFDDAGVLVMTATVEWFARHRAE